MSYKVAFHRKAEKALPKIPDKDRNRILIKIKSLSKNPRPMGYIKLSTREEYRIRSGNYRILYTIKKDVVDIRAIDDRKDAYR